MAIQQRKVVRATMMRSALHLVTTDDYLRFRRIIEAAIARALPAHLLSAAAEISIESIVTAARELLDTTLLLLTALRNELAQRLPPLDACVASYVVRTHLPIVHLPVPQDPGYPRTPNLVTTQRWLGSGPHAARALPDFLLHLPSPTSARGQDCYGKDWCRS